MKLANIGNPQSKILIVLDSYSHKDIEYNKLAGDGNGHELFKILNELGLSLQDYYITTASERALNFFQKKGFFKTKGAAKKLGLNLFRGQYVKPEDVASVERLDLIIKAMKPEVIIPLGEIATWAVTEHRGIGSWRGSNLTRGDAEVIPTYSMDSALRKWQWRYIMKHDIRKAVKQAGPEKVNPPDYKFQIGNSYNDTIDCLRFLLKKVQGTFTYLSFDIETKFDGISCIGIGWSPTEAICIPFVYPDTGDSYWTLEEESNIVLLLREIMTHENCSGIGQNWLYDAQYIARDWGFFLNIALDTMIAHHCLFCELPKALDFIASLYCDYYVYWKQEGRGWKNTDDNHAYWIYNAKDACYTWECAMGILQASVDLELNNIIEAQMAMFQPILLMMLRGTRICQDTRKELLDECEENREEIQSWLDKAVYEGFNINSPKQVKEFFYDYMQIKPVMVRNPQNKYVPSTNDKALKAIGKKDTLAAPISRMVGDGRQIKNAINVLNKETDLDGRMRCSYNIAGTITYRLASSTDAFGKGQNLQNVTKGHGLVPNLRKQFAADEGYILVDIDLPQADARVVAWDANDTELMDIFSDPTLDLHTENAKAIFGSCKGKGDPRRQAAKMGVHAANYLVKAKTLAVALGITVHEADLFLKRWFEAHPAIAEWHEDKKRELQMKGKVSNIFGYTWIFLDRIESRLKDVIAWIPQSTVGITINKGILNVHNDIPEAKVLLQVHDSGIQQIPTSQKDILLPALKQAYTITIPYERPLVMEPSVEIGKSWGELEEWTD